MRIQNGCHLISTFTQHSNVISNTFGVYSYFFSFFFLVFGDLSLYIPGWSWTPLYRPSCPWNHSNQPVTISRVLGLKSCTIPSLYHYDGISLDSQIKMKTMTWAYIVPKIHIIVPHTQIFLTLQQSRHKMMRNNFHFVVKIYHSFTYKVPDNEYYAATSKYWKQWTSRILLPR